MAARYARSYLDAPQRAREQRQGLIAFAAILLVAFFMFVAFGWASSGPVESRAGVTEQAVIVASGFAAMAVLLLPLIVRRVRIARSFRIETANRLALGGSLADGEMEAAPAVIGPAVTGREPFAGAGVAVRYEPRRVMRAVAPLLVLTCFAGAVDWAAFGALTGVGHVNAAVLALLTAFTAFLILALAPLVTLLVRSVAKPRPFVTMDPGGLHLPLVACTLPWAELAEVRLISMRYARRSGQRAVILAFVPRDPAGVLSSLRATGRLRRRMEKSLQVHGTPLAIADSLADHSGAEIAAAVGRFTAVAVRRY